jgi:hypothetical protein
LADLGVRLFRCAITASRARLDGICNGSNWVWREIAGGEIGGAKRRGKSGGRVIEYGLSVTTERNRLQIDVISGRAVVVDYDQMPVR